MGGRIPTAPLATTLAGPALPAYSGVMTPTQDETRSPSLPLARIVALPPFNQISALLDFYRLVRPWLSGPRLGGMSRFWNMIQRSSYSTSKVRLRSSASSNASSFFRTTSSPSRTMPGAMVTSSLTEISGSPAFRNSSRSLTAIGSVIGYDCMII
jgi:hypothetical protein